MCFTLSEECPVDCVGCGKRDITIKKCAAAKNAKLMNRF